MAKHSSQYYHWSLPGDRQNIPLEKQCLVVEKMLIQGIDSVLLFFLYNLQSILQPYAVPK